MVWLELASVWLVWEAWVVLAESIDDPLKTGLLDKVVRRTTRSTHDQ